MSIFTGKVQWLSRMEWGELCPIPTIIPNNFGVLWGEVVLLLLNFLCMYSQFQQLLILCGYTFEWKEVKNTPQWYPLSTIHTYKYEEKGDTWLLTPLWEQEISVSIFSKLSIIAPESERYSRLYVEFLHTTNQNILLCIENIETLKQQFEIWKILSSFDIHMRDHADILEALLSAWYQIEKIFFRDILSSKHVEITPDEYSHGEDFYTHLRDPLWEFVPVFYVVTPEWATLCMELHYRW